MLIINGRYPMSARTVQEILKRRILRYPCSHESDSSVGNLHCITFHQNRNHSPFASTASVVTFSDWHLGIDSFNCSFLQYFGIYIVGIQAVVRVAVCPFVSKFDDGPLASWVERLCRPPDVDVSHVLDRRWHRHACNSQDIAYNRYIPLRSYCTY